MCGFVGIVVPDGKPDLAEVQAMRDRLTHRGPDDAGLWSENDVAFGHRRLAVIDLSHEGHQPMISPSGRFVLVFNGEIYNFKDLTAQLPGIVYRGHSDTEVLLHAIEQWGVQGTLPRLIGMFSFAVLDRHDRCLHLVRDRLGIKPLYYGWHERRFVIASELSAVDGMTGPRPSISGNSLASMLRHNHVPAPYCIYEKFAKLSPGNRVTLNLDNLIPGHLPDQVEYWSIQSVASQTMSGDDLALETGLLERLRAAVKCRMIADVPLGGFLSGGIDSTLITALMQEQSSQSVQTFTVGFKEEAFNEAEHARRIAQHLGTDHTEVYLDENNVLDAVSRLPALCDEPFADASILPTYLLCQAARKNVTVALTGDGGDEVLWGYARYPIRERLSRLRQRVPSLLVPGLTNLLRSRLLSQVMGQLPLPKILGRRSRLGDKLAIAADMLEAGDENDIYLHLMSHWKNPAQIVPQAVEPGSIYRNPPAWVQDVSAWRRMSLMDLCAYLPDDCLTKVDRASMAVSLEARVPLLDHRVVEYCYQLPEHLIRQGATGKILFRNILERYVPRELIDRPKTGFGVPLGNWLRGPLKSWATDLLSESSLRATHLIDPVPVQRLLVDHIEHGVDWSAYLWDVLMFQVWYQARQGAPRTQIGSKN